MTCSTLSSIFIVFWILWANVRPGNDWHVSAPIDGCCWTHAPLKPQPMLITFAFRCGLPNACSSTGIQLSGLNGGRRGLLCVPPFVALFAMLWLRAELAAASTPSPVCAGAPCSALWCASSLAIPNASRAIVDSKLFVYREQVDEVTGLTQDQEAKF
jgi:hypothetical protein